MNSVSARIQKLLEGQSLLIGSGNAADVRIQGFRIATTHARISKVVARVFVQDLDTEHGTFVNGIEVRGAVRLNSGDLLRLSLIHI